MFCPALGVPEDPVSGNAHAMLGVYLLHQGIIGPPRAPPSRTAAPHVSTIEFSGAQGHHLGRPGRVTVALNLERQLLQSVTVVGEAVVVFEAALEF
jgi:PhzF family phenazine biosynthesis protein